ncbi:MAG TPA: dihydroorotate dehydrogenase [Cytophagales bacterium]|jgi:dihydroorotate dehydrogenase (fumarate)|nr:dihydroorotate dehydrogenase [Cytophagales bacterium]
MSLNLTVSYGGLVLKNPIVIGASNLVSNPHNLEKLEEAGAAAIVFKSLFEEQIQYESLRMDEINESYSNWDSEHSSFFPPIRHAGPAEHLLQLKEARSKIKIPLIGSLNCINNDSWLEYALKMEDTGIDALEVNFYHNQIDFDLDANAIEEKQLKTLEVIRAGVRLPLFVKLSSFYTNALHLISRMDKIGVDGFVLFNRLFQPDIDIDLEAHHYPYNFSSESDNRLALRYAGLLHQKIRGGVICNTGIMNGKDVLKMILAGANAVQVVSAVYKRGISTISNMIAEIEGWMMKKKYSSLLEIQGKLSKENLPDPFAYKRAQYVDILMKSELFMQYHPKRGELEDRHHDNL